MARIIYRVEPNHDQWIITRDDKLAAHFRIKADAAAAAVRLAHGAHEDGHLVQLVIHRADGTVEDERTYGKDPYPPPG